MKLEMTRAVAGVKAGPVGVEDADQMGVDAARAVIGHHQRLGIALGFVVDRAGADRVHVAPVALCLRMLDWVAVALGSGGVQVACAVFGGDIEGVFRAGGANAQGFDG